MTHGPEHPSHGQPLTGRQLEMLTLAAYLTQRQIGQELAVTEACVSMTLKRARLKLGAKTTAKAVWLAREQGLIR